MYRHSVKRSNDDRPSVPILTLMTQVEARPNGIDYLDCRRDIYALCAKRGWLTLGEHPNGVGRVVLLTNRGREVLRRYQTPGAERRNGS
jgi:hypothetical protein